MLISLNPTPSEAHVHARGDHHHYHDDDGEFWAEGRIWNNYQEWSQSEEFKNSFPHYSCGMEDPTMEELKGSHQVTEAWLKVHACDKHDGRNPHCPPSSRLLVSPINIQVKWHSIAQNDGRAAATLEQIVDSIDTLNAAYAHPTGGFFFQFDPLTDLTVHSNSWWHFSDDIDDTQFKSLLRQGDCSTLNIYTTGSFAGIFGWAVKAFKCEEGQECIHLCQQDMTDDGVVLRYDLVAGGPVTAFNEGDVLVHEVGHWLGLYHTFQGGGCSYPGDFIDDTPAERQPAFGCEKVKDSCTGKNDFPAGVDPIHNYMNLSNDACMFEFTDGQFAWMYAQWDAYRASATVPPTTPPPAQPTTTVPNTLPPTPTNPPVPATITLSPVFTVSPINPPTEPTSWPPVLDFFTPSPMEQPPEYLTVSPIAVTPQQPTASLPATFPPVSSAIETPSPTFTAPISQQKVVPDAKCGTVGTQSGYGGAAGQAKGCSNRRTEEEDGKKRRIKGQ